MKSRRVNRPFLLTVISGHTYRGDVIAPLSQVVVKDEFASSASGYADLRGRTLRVGYYSRRDGMNCVWLVDEGGNYFATVDQNEIAEKFDVIVRSSETDLHGDSRECIEELRRSA